MLQTDIFPWVGYWAHFEPLQSAVTLRDQSHLPSTVWAAFFWSLLFPSEVIFPTRNQRSCRVPAWGLFFFSHFFPEVKLWSVMNQLFARPGTGEDIVMILRHFSDPVRPPEFWRSQISHSTWCILRQATLNSDIWRSVWPWVERMTRLSLLSLTLDELFLSSFLAVLQKLG